MRHRAFPRAYFVLGILFKMMGKPVKRFVTKLVTVKLAKKLSQSLACVLRRGLPEYITTCRWAQDE